MVTRKGILQIGIKIRASISVLKFAIYISISLLPFQAACASDLASASRQTRLSHQQTAAKSAHRPWAWEIQTGSAKIWIVGCLHLGSAQDALVFSAYLPIYRMASTVYFETAPNSSQSHDVKRLVGRRGLLADQQTISSRIATGTWQKLTAVLATRPAKLAAVSKMEPWLAAFTLIQDGYARAGLDSENSLEMFIQKLAVRDRKPIGAIETSKDQVLAMADTSLSDQEAFLRDTLDGLESIDSETQAIRDAWTSGNQLLLQSALGIGSTPPSSGMHESLIGKRNERWVDKIREIAERGKNSLVVVGVEHVVSTPNGLPELLGKAGFAVHRVER